MRRREIDKLIRRVAVPGRGQVRGPYVNGVGRDREGQGGAGRGDGVCAIPACQVSGVNTTCLMMRVLTGMSTGNILCQEMK